MKGKYKMNNNLMTLNINEGFTIKDAIKVANDLEKPYLRGVVTFRDPITGDIIEKKENLILLRSRAYILELLFGLSASNETGYIKDKARTVCLFKIGQGGADLLSSPLEAIAPKFNNTDLYSKVPFIIEDPNKSIDELKNANPSIFTKLTDEQKHVYYLPEEHPDGSTRYFGKIFEKDTQRLKINTSTNECYVHLTLRVSPTEARGFVCNELGLILARYDEPTNTYLNPELFSHITFSSYALTSLTRGMLIDYQVYA